MTSTARPVHRFAHQAMGTFFEAAIAGEEPGYANQAAAAVFKEIDRVERFLTRFDPGSEVSQINRLRPGESLAIGVETHECLDMAERVRAETAGAFDANVRGKAKHRSPGQASIPSDEEFPSFVLSRTSSGFAISLASAKGGAGMHLDLDLGGIGKGYALDRALETLADWGIGNALVHGGTSTAVAAGPGPEGVGWPVGIGGGWPGAPRKMLLSGKALSGSGTEVKGRHILDPRTGAPAGGHLAAWAMHPSAAVSDALSTALMVMTTAEVEDYCRRHPEVWALVIPSYGKSRTFDFGDR
jgi:thiamine biosynthesis lipoprotein